MSGVRLLSQALTLRRSQFQALLLPIPLLIFWARNYYNRVLVTKVWFTIIWGWKLCSVTSVNNVRLDSGSNWAFPDTPVTLRKLQHNIREPGLMLLMLRKLQHHIVNQAWCYWHYVSSSVILWTRLDATDAMQAPVSYCEPGLMLLTLRKL